MHKIIEAYERESILPEIQPGEIVYQTEHYRVVTDYKYETEASRFFVIPKRDGEAVFMLFEACIAHNIYAFQLLPVELDRGLYYLPALEVAYTASNIPPLLNGLFEIPNLYDQNCQTIPSPDHLEYCLRMQPVGRPTRYFFVEEGDPFILDPMTRRLRVLLNAFSDEIPAELLSGISRDRYRKVRRNWFNGVLHAFERGVSTGEFTDPEIIQKIRVFTRYLATDFKRKELTSADDIGRANELIRRITGDESN